MAESGSGGFSGSGRNLHRVRRLSIALTGPEEAALLEARAYLAAEAERLEEAFAPVFDAHAPPHDLIRLERLEIELASDAALDATSLAAALDRALARALPEHKRFDADASGARAPSRGDPAGWLAEALAFFLQRGVFPWWAPAARIAEIDAALAELTDAEIATVARHLAPVLLAAPAATRFLLQVAPAAARRIAIALPRAGGGSVPASAWPTLSDWRAAALAPARGEASIGPREALVAMIRRAAGAATTPPNDEMNNVVTDTRQPHARPLVETVEDWPTPGEDAGPLAIPHAGVVLAGPFLPALFDRLDLLADRTFRDIAAAERAGAIIAALAGGPPNDEPSMALAKLMTGRPLEAPQPRVINTTEAEKQAVDTLLASMVGHWTALGHATPDGLRETFLRRPGHLILGANADRLKIEPRGTDVLLDRLPWPLSPLRLPWMAQPLVVDWR
ncbi:hypothetical protein DKT77_19085 [Meridianimarinicoccus roseus]|uniref:Uncharacterized protein n=1 Tax=Meridianimarinicoccus roseus TaxID=2072018 RepID=A0A2V2LCQ6_9RHOB|nr:contractile injection system tape measure protein [Meridianimarinicoccus roseus]PWR01037.1 hypothetical protein DKT77_19085 [Meridianimarinicoccus roseus]